MRAAARDPGVALRAGCWGCRQGDTRRKLERECSHRKIQYRRVGRRMRAPTGSTRYPGRAGRREGRGARAGFLRGGTNLPNVGMLGTLAWGCENVARGGHAFVAQPMHERAQRRSADDVGHHDFGHGYNHLTRRNRRIPISDRGPKLHGQCAPNAQLQFVAATR
jgi:hypothetical protein